MQDTSRPNYKPNPNRKRNRYGPIPGIEPGTTFESRCAVDFSPITTDINTLACYPSIGKLVPKRVYTVSPSRVFMGQQQPGRIRYACQAYTKTIKMTVTPCALPLVACQTSHSPSFQCLHRYGGEAGRLLCESSRLSLRKYADSPSFTEFERACRGSILQKPIQQISQGTP